MPCSAQKLPDLANRVRGRASDPDGLRGATDLLQGEEVMPDREREAAVAAAGARAAQPSFNHGHLGRGRELLDPQRGPQAREAAADDADVRAPRALEDGRRLGWRCVAQPPVGDVR